jgi:LPXTG-site transpeptidase (sortase) family protein
VIDSSTHATVAAFSTSFESNTSDSPAVMAAPVSGSYATSFNKITVTFNEALNDPLGNFLPDDVTNPKNYRFFQPGSNGVFDTVECSTGIQGDDSAISLDSVVYSSGLFQSVLSINGGSNLPAGQYRLLVCGTTSLVNTLGIPLNDEPGTDSSYDFTIKKASSSPTATPTVSPLTAASAAGGLPIPLTGFAPGRISALPKQVTAYADLGSLWLEIPTLGVKASIVGVPQTASGWDVSWLGSEIGWLNGTAWPSWNGNSVLTAHVYNADGLAGPFVDLSSLKWGDAVLLHSGKSVYTYEVRENFKVNPSELGKVTQHEELPWLTLVTCSSFDEASGTYLKRVVVRAVLIEKQ